MRALKASRNRILRNEKGQSTIEFALTLILLIGFTFFYFQICMVFAFGSYAHYATFMSARAFLSAGANPQDQVDRARTVIVKMLKKSEGSAGADRFPGIAKGQGDEDVAGFKAIRQDGSDPNLSWMEGVRYTFRSKLFPIPFGGASSDPRSGALGVLNLTSESWLGRDETAMECMRQMDKKGIFDNGC